ncbi:hypothetical protein [Paraburkholderia sp. BL6669N2]|uniref:hypothetical protein n=1 Tax=Paraburkholderia sp. BL6669N2 TaxID=1938807 RepID=UPI001C6EECD2|nr:hypothetical protein [Paraburkholderia sp. BL6669N2]
MLKKTDTNGVAPEALEGARSATGSASGAAEVKRWSTGRKRGVVLRLLRGEPVDAVSREVGVTIAELEQWRELALAGMEAGLKARTSDPLEARLNNAVRRVGELSMENEILRKERELQARRPLTARRSSTWAARSPLVRASPLDCNGLARCSDSPARRSMLSALGRRTASCRSSRRAAARNRRCPMLIC